MAHSQRGIHYGLLIMVNRLVYDGRLVLCPHRTKPGVLVKIKQRRIRKEKS